MDPQRAFDDFYGLLSDLESPVAVWEKNNLFLTLSYLDKSEIPAGLEALAKHLQKPLDEISMEFQAYNIETEKMRNQRGGGR